MRKKTLGDRIEDIESNLLGINEKLKQITDILQQKPQLPDRASAPNPLGYKIHRSHKLIGGFRDPEIRDIIIKLRTSDGMHYSDIEAAIRDAFPDKPEKHVSRSAIHRFCESARKGRLIEYGISATLNKINLEGVK